MLNWEFSHFVDMAMIETQSFYEFKFVGFNGDERIDWSCQLRKEPDDKGKWEGHSHKLISEVVKLAREKWYQKLRELKGANE